MRRPKPRSLALLGLVAAVALLAGTAVLAQVSPTYNLTWNVVSSGGGSGSAAPYGLDGTIGQPIAGGPLSANPYTLDAGYAAGAGDGKFKVYAPGLAKGP